MSGTFELIHSAYSIQHDSSLKIENIIETKYELKYKFPKKYIIYKIENERFGCQIN